MPGLDHEYSDDRELMRGFLDGDAAAVKLVQGWVDGVVYLGNWRFEDSEGIAQEVLLKLLKIVRGGGFSGQSKFKTFVFSVAKHTCIDVYRRERFRSNIPPEELEPVHAGPSGPHPQAQIEQDERIEYVKYVFQQLPDECKRLWRWVYCDHETAASVGERLGISAANVRVRVHRCLEKARRLGKGFEGVPPEEVRS